MRLLQTLLPRFFKPASNYFQEMNLLNIREAHGAITQEEASKARKEIEARYDGHPSKEIPRRTLSQHFEESSE